MDEKLDNPRLGHLELRRSDHFGCRGRSCLRLLQ